MTEAERLVKAGVKELLVISQDTSAYGLDLKYAESPWKGAAAARRASSISARRWARSAPGCGCTTSIPIRMSTSVIPLMAEGKILPYLDIPFQHASPAVLKAMRRPAHAGEDARAARGAGARSAPTSPSARPSSSAFPARRKRTSSSCSTGCARRSSSRVGCFRYEPVEGAAANDLPGAVPDEVKDERWHRFMAVAAGGERGDGLRASSAARST